jgi:hypothetical protein
MILNLTYSEVINVTDWPSQVKTFVENSLTRTEAIAQSTLKALCLKKAERIEDEELNFSVEALPDDSNQTKIYPSAQQPTIFRFTVTAKYEFTS